MRYTPSSLVEMTAYRSLTLSWVLNRTELTLISFSAVHAWSNFAKIMICENLYMRYMIIIWGMKISLFHYFNKTLQHFWKLSHIFQKSSQRWRPAQRGTGSVLPQAIVSNLMGRDITNEDYDMLLQLDKYVDHEISKYYFFTCPISPKYRKYPRF